jgi:dipeptidyl aminopeptidase/acylaminoacyl peptidase
MFLLVACPLMGQDRHKTTPIPKSEYGKWGTLSLRRASPDGRWVSFEMAYDDHADTLFVSSVDATRQYTFASGRAGAFAGKGYFACLLPGQRLQLQNLGTGTSRVVSGVGSFEFIDGGKHLAVFGNGRLVVMDTAGRTVAQKENITGYLASPGKDKIAYATNNSVGIICPRRNHDMVLPGSNENAGKLAWQDDGNGVVFVTDGPESQVLSRYTLSSRKMVRFDLNKAGRRLYKGMALHVARGGRRVFAYVLPAEVPAQKEPGIEIWNGNDKCLFEEQQRRAGFGPMPDIFCWDVARNTLVPVTSPELPEVMFDPAEGYALLSNRYAYGTIPKYFDFVDYYLMDLGTGQKKLLLEKQSRDMNLISFSAFGHSVLYYQGVDWWLYDMADGTHRNLTHGMGIKWDNNSGNAAHHFEVYGSPGWTADGRYVLLQDEFDLWAIAVNGNGSYRLTKGREQNVIYRVAAEMYEPYKANYDGRAAKVFDLNKGIILETAGTSGQSGGYAKYNKKNGLAEIVFSPRHHSQFKESPGGFAFVEEAFDSAPVIRYVRPDGAGTVVYSSNRQTRKYSLGKADIIRYGDGKGHTLKAALFYPAGYEPARTYPMVVWIYSDVSKNVNHFVNPSYSNGEGFNVTNLTQEGYFVLMPDIYYELRDTGISAARCVEAAVMAVRDTGIIGKVGLVGHSFGGYETSFVITHTNLFSAAISGAGVSDSVAFYFNVTDDGGAVPDMWRFEDQQFRAGKSLYDDKAAYLRNSPIMAADKVETPLLLWSGKEDPIIPVSQSVSYYLALRRLGKPCILLAYPGEGHSLEKAENMEDLTRRTSEWFGHYLKGEQCDWITKGTK